MEENKDRELLSRVNDIEDFSGSVLFRDHLDDWSLAKDLGDFLLRIDPEDITAHVFLAKAYRHLGDLPRAAEELKQCQALLGRKESPVEAEVIPPILAEEERLLSPNKPQKL